jgi:L-lactate dehydrogenase complex protein LldE
MPDARSARFDKVHTMPPTSVQLFVTCLVDGFAPEVGEATVRLIESQGIRVEFPFDQTCCGQPAFNTGFAREARRMARHTIDVLAATKGPIVVPSGSCAQMMVHHYSALLAEDEHYLELAEAVAGRVRELTQFLVDDLGLSAVGASAAGGRHRGTVTYHPSCHGLRGLGLTYQAQQLLDGVDGLIRVGLPDAEECCGFGGMFAAEMPEVSVAMAADKAANIAASGADAVVGGDIGCLLHLEGYLRRNASPIRVRHIAEVLDGAPEA